MGSTPMTKGNLLEYDGVPGTILRIHPNISGFWVGPSSTGSMTEGVRALID